MPSTVLTITISEAIEEEVVEALCGIAGLPESPANAKQALIQKVQRNVVAWKQQQALTKTEEENGKIQPPEGFS